MSRTPTTLPARHGWCDSPNVTASFRSRRQCHPIPRPTLTAEQQDHIVTAEEHDVFGDGTVVIKSSPGHTPGHKSVREAPKTGCGAVGDLYHYPEERTLNRLPVTEFDEEQTRRSREALEAFLKQSGAQLWIQHDLVAHAKLRKAPGYYD